MKMASVLQHHMAFFVAELYIKMRGHKEIF